MACCGSCMPRYKRLVDGIFPRNPNSGLDRDNMTKLSYYALTKGKLDLIGEYLCQTLTRDLRHRSRHGFVPIAMQAMDQLLVACHSHSLNLIVDSFLKMVQKLLEQHDIEFQILGTNSFGEFAKIEEEAASYHRRYDFFIDKFSSMCHNNHANGAVRARVRVAGIKGLQGVFRKLAADDLQDDIWASTHMNKIVPSLLFNMGDASFQGLDFRDDENPHKVAESALRDLVCRASLMNIEAIIKPVLTHFDNHELWVPNDFALVILKIYMYSIQPQYAYAIIQLLMSHLETKKDSPKIRTSIINLLSEIVAISASGTIGPSVHDLFYKLLRHLRQSIAFRTDDEVRIEEERKLQEAIINCMGELAKSAPDYQKIELIRVVFDKMPGQDSFRLDHDRQQQQQQQQLDANELRLQTMLLKTVQRIASRYVPEQMSKSLPQDLMEPLLRMCGIRDDPNSRLIVQQILHLLIDRHQNLDKLKTVSIPKQLTDLDLKVEVTSRMDLMFMRRHGHRFYWHLFETLRFKNNKVVNIEAVYTTLALLYIEVGDEDITVELVGLAFKIQDLAASDELPIVHRCCIHALVAAFLNLIAHLIDSVAMQEHISQVLEKREQTAAFMLPEHAFNRSNTETNYPKDVAALKEGFLFDKQPISDALQASAYDTSKMDNPILVQPDDVDFVDRDRDRDTTASDLQSISIDLASNASTPDMIRRYSKEDFCFQALKATLKPRSADERRKLEQEQRRLIFDYFKKTPFDEIRAKSEKETRQMVEPISDVFENLAKEQKASEDDEGFSSSESILFPSFFTFRHQFLRSLQV